MDLQEALLIKRSKAGDIESFEKLIVTHQKKAFNIAYRMLKDLEDANDVTQDAFIKAYNGIKNFNNKSSFSTWLYTIVNNACIDFIRKNKKHNVIYIDHEYETEKGDYKRQVSSDDETPEEILEKKEVKQFIHKAIEELNDEHRNIVILRDIQNFSYKEIAEILSLSEGTVKSRISRARNNLKTIIEGKIEFERE